VPDLTLVGVVVATARTPARWLLWASLAGLMTSVWAVRFAAAVFGGYLVLGWVLQGLARRWDTTDLRVECLIAAAAVAILTVGLVWLDDLWSPAILGLTMGRAAMSTFALVVLRATTAKGWS
jgi:hypothetical protein